MSAEDARSGDRFGGCPHCGAVVRLDFRGAVYPHRRTAYLTIACSGSNRWPVSILCERSRGEPCEVHQ